MLLYRTKPAMNGRIAEALMALEDKKIVLGYHGP
jgi:hypothetical protein